MDIRYQNTKLLRDCNDIKQAVRRWGARGGELVLVRLQQLRACRVLLEMRDLPQVRCHELKGERKGQLSVDLDHPRRLIFKPSHQPVPRTAEGGLDWSKVTAVIILGVEDTHG